MTRLTSLPSWVCLLGFVTGGSHDDSLDTARIGGQVGGGQAVVPLAREACYIVNTILASNV